MSKTTFGTILVFIAAVNWGLVSIAGEYLTDVKGLDAVWVTSVRLTIAGLIMLAAAAVTLRRQAAARPDASQNPEIRQSLDASQASAAPARPASIFSIWDRGTWLRLLAYGILGFGGSQATYFVAIHFSNAGTATAIQNTAPVMILVWTLLREHRRPYRYEIASLVIVLAGVFLLSTHGDPSTLVISTIGLIMAVLSAAACAIYSMLPDPLLRDHGAVCTTGWGMFLGGMVLAPICRIWAPVGTFDFGTLGGFVFLILLGTIMTFGFYMKAIPLIGALKCSLICLLEPVVSTLVGAALFHTRFIWIDYTAIGLIIVGVAVLILFGNRQDPAPPAERSSQC